MDMLLCMVIAKEKLESVFFKVSTYVKCLFLELKEVLSQCYLYCIVLALGDVV